MEGSQHAHAHHKPGTGKQAECGSAGNADQQREHRARLRALAVKLLRGVPGDKIGEKADHG